MIDPIDSYNYHIRNNLYLTNKISRRNNINMSQEHIQLWDKCLSIIKTQVDPKGFKTWFAPLKSVKLDNNALTIQVPNKFFYEWIEEHYVSELGGALKKVLGPKARLEYNIKVQNHRTIGKIKKKKIIEQSKDGIKNPFVIPGIQKIKIESNLNPEYILDNYIEGECNKLARSAGIAIAKNPGKTAFNPLVIYGDVGVGKTHLINAIGNEILAYSPKKKILFVTTEKFTNQIIQAIKNNAVNDFMNFYQMLDVLIIDDIQFLAKRSKTQEIFFNIFNQLHQSNKQLIISSDKTPKELEDMQDRLISRFKWGLVTGLDAPSFDTRKEILNMIIENDHMDLTEDIIDFLCKNIKTNIRELEGVLVSMRAQSSLTDRVIDMKLAKEVVSQYVSFVSHELTIDNIKDLVAKFFNIPVEELDKKTRKRNIVEARHLSMYLCKEHTSETLKNIGRSFGKRDHSTVLYAIKAVENAKTTDMLFQDKLNDLQKEIHIRLNT